MINKLLILLMVFSQAAYAESPVKVNWVSMIFELDRAQHIFDSYSFRMPAPYLFTELGALGNITIMSTEVTCGQVESAVLSGAINPLSERGACEDDDMQPATQISFEDAAGVCTFLGGRLPTEVEWMSAFVSRAEGEKIRSTNVLSYNDFSSYVDDVDVAIEMPSLIYGMIGNVWEMTRTDWPSSSNKIIIKGGAFNMHSNLDLINPFLRASLYKNDFLNGNVGFRCVK